MPTSTSTPSSSRNAMATTSTGTASIAAATPVRTAFEFKGTVSTLAVLKLLTERIDLLDQELGKKIGKLPTFFLHAPVVIDLSPLEEIAEPIDFASMVQVLRRHNLVPVAVRNATAPQRRGAIASGLGVLHGEASRYLREQEAEPGGVTTAVTSNSDHVEAPLNAVASDAGKVPLRESMIVSQPVRGGQIVYAQQCDLIVLTSVNAGAEVIADGHIHIYGPLRGRALAGAVGNEHARIFCAQLNPELIGVAGQYLLPDEIPKDFIGKSVHVALQDKHLVFSELRS
jgi:septum site-determining protein MinC